MRKSRLPSLVAVVLACAVPWQCGAAETSPTRAALESAAKRLDLTVADWSQRADDGPWKPYHPGDRVGAAKFELGATWTGRGVLAGTSVTGTPLRAVFTASAHGLCNVAVSVDGKQVDSFTVDGGSGTDAEIRRDILLDGAAAARDYAIVVRVENVGYRPTRTGFHPSRKSPLAEEGLRFSLRAEALYPVAEPLRRELSDTVTALATAERLVNPDLVRRTFVGHAWPIADGRKTPPERLKSLNAQLDLAVAALDLKAAEGGDADKLRASIARVGPMLKEVRDYVHGFTFQILGNSHIDVAWLWRMAETRRVARNTYATVMENMAEYPELRYAQSQAVTYRWIEESDPALFKKIQEAVKAGRWEVVGGMWVEPDCNLISGESWARQILYGKTYFREKFGVDVKVGWNPDSFGYNWNMPQLYSLAGIRYFITQKIGWNDTTVFPHYLFNWEGVDGSRILAYFPPRPYDDDLKLDRLVTAMNHYEATTGSRDALVLYGLGDHGGGPNKAMLDRVRGYGKLPVSPRFAAGSALEFLERLDREEGPSLPVWKDELFLEYHRGTFTTQGAVKAGNRRAECGLGAAEKLASMAGWLLGAKYPAEALDAAWKETLTNQFHDILPGSSITPVYRDAAESFARIQKCVRGVVQDSGNAMAASVDTSRLAGAPLVVFNTLSWKRTDVVRAKLPEGFGSLVRVRDALGNDVPSELVEDDSTGSANVLFIAENVPALGWKTYSLAPEAPAISQGGPRAEGGVMENDLLKVAVDPVTGDLKSLIHKASGREFVPPGQTGNRLEIYEDRHESWDAWNIGYTGRKWSLDRADSAELVSAGPVRAVYRVKKSFLGLTKSREYPAEDFPSSFFTQDIIIYRGLGRVDIRNLVDWWEDHCLLKASFPTGIASETATFEIPFAAIARSTKMETPAEKARFETPALKWADLSDGEGGLSLLNDGKHGHDIHGGVIKLSLLRSPTWPDPVADRGKHEFAFSWYPHAGSWQDAGTVERAWEFNAPLVATSTGVHAGKLPVEGALLGFSSDGVVLDTVKRSQDGRGWVLRLYEPRGRSGKAALAFHERPSGAWEADLMEEKGGALKLSSGSNRADLDFRPYQIRTVLVTF